MIDSLLPLSELKDKYPDGHPDLTKYLWEDEYQDGEIGLSYWEWVQDELNGYNIRQNYLQQQAEFEAKYGKV